ncbi:MAG: glucose 1-dehydrogenase [Dehalococcoidia bacterium]|nr:glucose 1-dehydrogenase [Dehalococcoidia bacterium]
MDVNGKVAVVTGSSAGVGRATAELLASIGAKVVVNYAHSAADAEETVEAIQAAGGTAHAFQADVRDDASCRALIASAVDTYGGLHILVNNAGMTHFIPHAELDRLTDEVWNDTFSVNVQGTFNCTRAAVPHMRAAGEGAVVNVASIAGIRGVGSSIPYAASKAAIINMTKSLARVLGPEIRVNCIAPGFIDTRWLRGGMGERYDQAKATASEHTPLKAVATPETCADAILSFIQHNVFVTGQTVVVDGGSSL